MKYLKMLGLASVAALAVLAVVGASTASATAICKEASGEPLTCTSPHLSGLAVIGTASNPFLEVSATEKINCTSSTVKASATSGEKAGVDGTFKGVKITWSGCSNTVSGCSGSTTTVTSPGEYSGTFHYVGGMESTGSITKPETKVSMTCFGIPTTCTYVPGSVAGTYSDNSLTLTISQKIESPGFPCPAGTEKAAYVLHMEGEEPGMFFIANN